MLSQLKNGVLSFSFDSLVFYSNSKVIHIDSRNFPEKLNVK